MAEKCFAEALIFDQITEIDHANFPGRLSLDFVKYLIFIILNDCKLIKSLYKLQARSEKIMRRYRRVEAKHELFARQGLMLECLRELGKETSGITETARAPA